MANERKWIDVDLGRVDGSPSDPGYTKPPEDDAPQRSGSTDATHRNRRPSADDTPTTPVQRDRDAGRTVGPLSDHRAGAPFEPVVGWFVCVKGDQRGESFALYPRRNVIGRSDDADVSLVGDAQVSRRHAILTYDPEAVEYVLQVSEESSQALRVNDEAIYTPVRLSAYDAIRLGATVLLFIPFCSERFAWST
jgi:hypothetical protein